MMLSVIRGVSGFSFPMTTRRGFVRPSVASLKMRKAKHDDNTDIRGMSPLYTPRTENQREYMKYLGNQSVPLVLGIGPAGTGKTLMACIQAVNELKSGNIKKIIMTRPVVTVEEDIGFLPGNLIHKMNPWTRPMFDILLEYYSQKDIDFMLQSGVLEISPLGFMRGRTFKRAFIIADEMQNSSPAQMMMLVTRIGDGARMVITGDLQQSDRMENNGLLEFLGKIRKYRRAPLDTIKLVEMTTTDVQRSPIVSQILDIYANKPTVTHSLPLSVKNITNDAAILPIIDNIRLESKYIWKPENI
ncbi:MAG: PhoH family protein [Alphaproteobacteria bacterium]|nr:PhoH family protein [Alphaproteobacteria bacterium]